MGSITTKRYEMLKRTRDFGIAQTTAFPEGSFGKELLATVAQVIAELDNHSTSQSSGKGAAQSITATKAALREDLRELILAINRTARVLAFETPGLENQFRLPRGTNDQALLNAARAFAADAAPLKAAFLKHEMPADFIERLTQLIADFEKVSTEKASAVGAHVPAKIAMDETVARGLQAVRQLDVVIRNKFNGDPAMLANWTRASHVAYRTRNNTPEPPPDDPHKPPTPNS
ncbi:MAG: hypothetical protein HYR56_06015 [Acidobacteria bacterium]|nr:hypothetical protein [Acidobacteriota bacterium]MBI3424684.1 hypothetical protein [Acidobacteriota bacterium]